MLASTSDEEAHLPLGLESGHVADGEGHRAPPEILGHKVARVELEIVKGKSHAMHAHHVGGSPL